MALFLIDTDMAAHFLTHYEDVADDASCVESFLTKDLYADIFWNKPLPTLPVSLPTSPTTLRSLKGRLSSPPLATMPDPNMQQRLVQQDAQLSYRSWSFSDDCIASPEFEDGNSASLGGSSCRRTSSIYSIESSQSSDTLGSTISEILDMYTGLIDKVSHYQRPSNLKRWESRAYRDTVAPLLLTRFHSRRSASSTPPGLPQNPVPKDHELRMQPVCPPRQNRKPVPGFQEFSRNLKNRRIELESPISTISTTSSENSRLLSSDSVSEPSPIVSSTRPFSWIKSSSRKRSGSDDGRAISPLRDPDDARDLISLSGIRVEVRSSGSDMSGRQEKAAGVSQAKGMSTHAKSQGLNYQLRSRDVPHNRAPHHVQRQYEQVVPSGRYYRHVSTASDSADGPVVRPAMGDRVISRIAEKVNEIRLSKHNANPDTNPMSRHSSSIPIATRQVPTPVSARRQAEMNIRTDGATQNSTRTVTIQGHLAVPPIESTKRLASVPVTFDAILNNTGCPSEQRLSHQYSQEDSRYLSAKSDSYPRPKSENPQSYQGRQPGYRRVASAERANNIDLAASPGRMTGLKAALEGAKKNLMLSSAEKRRENLKASIVVIGP